MNPKERQRRNEATIFVACGLAGMVGVWFWTESGGAIFAFLGIAALIGECARAITWRLDALIDNTNGE